MYKHNIEAAGISYPCDLPSNFILHINKYARFDEYTQPLLGYTDISIYVMFNWSYCISMAINAFKNRESYKYTLQLDGFVIRKRGVIMAKYIKWYNICSQTYLPYDLAIDKCTTSEGYPVGPTVM